MIDNPKHALDGAFERIIRAGEHLAELERATRAYAKAYNDLTVPYYDTDPPHYLRTKIPIRDGPVVSQRVGVLIGEICYNLRSALDYLVFEIAKRDSNGVIQEGTQFPICDTKELFDAKTKSWLKGVNAVHVAAIERLQPYSGCDWTKVLREISNPDKHRQLTGAGSGGTFWATPLGAPVPVGHICSIRRTIHYPSGLEVEVQVVSTSDIHIPTSPSPRVQVGKPAVELLEMLKTKVSQTLVDFKPEFEGRKP